MIGGTAWLLVCQLAGEVLVRVIGLPVPGPVVGLVVLFVALQVRQRRAAAGGPAAGAGAGDPSVVRAADGFLAHLQLLFVPAGVGIVAYLGLLRTDAAPLLAGLLASWAVGLVVVGHVAQVLHRSREVA